MLVVVEAVHLPLVPQGSRVIGSRQKEPEDARTWNSTSAYKETKTVTFAHFCFKKGNTDSRITSSDFEVRRVFTKNMLSLYQL